MNIKMKLFTFLAAILFLTFFLCIKASSQSKNQIPQGFTTKSVPRGNKSLEVRPSDDSERIKYRIEIKRDSCFYNLKADKYENGIYIYEQILEELDHKRKVYKGEITFFEIIPDVSNHSRMTLFICYPSMTRYRYLDSAENKQIKYRKFKNVDHTKFNMIPLMICYMDDEHNNVEKLLDKYSKENLVTLTSKNELQDKILKYIEKCILIYYNLNDE